MLFFTNRATGNGWLLFPRKPFYRWPVGEVHIRSEANGPKRLGSGKPSQKKKHQGFVLGRAEICLLSWLGQKMSKFVVYQNCPNPKSVESEKELREWRCVVCEGITSFGQAFLELILTYSLKSRKKNEQPGDQIGQTP